MSDIVKGPNNIQFLSGGSGITELLSIDKKKKFNFIRSFDTLSKKVRRYFPDFLIKVKTAEGDLKTHLIEVKPSKDLRPPVSIQGKKRSTVLYEMKTYQMNRDKFASARKWCNDRGIIFDIWTEKHLQQRG